MHITTLNNHLIRSTYFPIGLFSVKVIQFLGALPRAARPTHSLVPGRGYRFASSRLLRSSSVHLLSAVLCPFRRPLSRPIAAGTASFRGAPAGRYNGPPCVVLPLLHRREAIAARARSAALPGFPRRGSLEADRGR